MFVSQTVMGFLDRAGIDFELITHRHTACSVQTARAANVEPSQLAKGVLLRDEEDYVLAVVPASRHVNAWALASLIDGDGLSLAREHDMRFIFRDCERGALPVIGSAFGVRTVVDDELLAQPDVYFEAGDHERLVHLRGAAFAQLMADHPHGRISG